MRRRASPGTPLAPLGIAGSSTFDSVRVQGTALTPAPGGAVRGGMCGAGGRCPPAKKRGTFGLHPAEQLTWA